MNEEMIKFYRRITIMFISAIVVVLIVFLGVIPLIKYLRKPAFLDVLVAPIDAKIMINGSQYRNATYEFEPGKYEATISKDGFKTKEVKLNLEKNKTSGLYLYLVPEDGDWNFYQEGKNEESLKALLRMNGYNTDGSEVSFGIGVMDGDESALRFIEKEKVREIMPINVSVCGKPATRMNCDVLSVEYDYAKECGNKICLVITGRGEKLNSEGLKEIKTRMKEKGYDFNDYEYTYRQNSEI